MSDSFTAVSDLQQTEPQPGDPTIFGLLSGVIIRPRQTFTRLREAKRGYWWVPFLLTVLAAALLAFAKGSIQMEAMQNFTPPEGMEIPEGVVVSSPTMVQLVVLPLIASIVGMLLGYVLSTLVVFALGFVFGGKATLKQMFWVVVWASFPAIIRYLVQAAASLITGGLPVSGLSAALTPLETMNMPILSLLLGRIDIYLIWSLVLLGIGVSATTKLSKGKSALVVLLYLLIVALTLIGFSWASQAIANLFGGNNTFGGPGLRGGPR